MTFSPSHPRPGGSSAEHEHPHRYRRHSHHFHGAARRSQSATHPVPPPHKAHTQGPETAPDQARTTPGSASSVPTPLPTLDVSPHTAHAPLPPPRRVPTVRAHPRVHIRSRPRSPRTPTAQDYEESPRPAIATSPHNPDTPNHAHSSAQDRGPAQGQWWQRWTHTQLWERRKWARAEPSLEGLVHRPRKGSVKNCHLRPAGGWMPQAAWEAMMADALHPLGVHPRNLPAPQDHSYVLRRLQETLQETQRDGIRLWDIIQSPILHTHTPSPPHKRQRTDTGVTHRTPGALRATNHDAPDPPASGAATQPRYTANHRRGAPRQAQPRGHQASQRMRTHTTTGTATPKGTEPRLATVTTA